MRESKVSRRYTMRCDKLREFLFFEGQYKKRCFLRDNFEKYEADIHLYNVFFNNIRMFLYRYMLVDPDDDFQPFFDEEKQISERIEQLQIFYSCMCNSDMYKIYRSMIEKYDFCNYFYKYNHWVEVVRKFCIVSEKYGLFISDIFSTYKIEKITMLDAKIENSEIYKPYPDISAMNNYLNYEDYASMKNIQKNRFYTLIDKLSTGKELTRPEKSLASSLLKKSVANNCYKYSYKSRKIGLWIWDSYINPLNKKITLKMAIDNLCQSEITDSFGEEDFNRSMKRILNNTIESIEKRSVVPFKK